MSNNEMSQEEYETMVKSLETTIKTNVYEEKDFKNQFLMVFKTMSEILSKTLGPYGSSTMIDELKNYCVTKDGFHVLKNLKFADFKQNRIHSILFSISHQMVTKVGDGSTSAVVAAYNFLNEMIEYSYSHKNIRPKEINERIQEIVDELCNIISKNATPVNNENLIDVVTRITNIATNENKKYTEMIREIYSKLGANCTINISDSKIYEDGIEYEDGVYSTESYLIDPLYHNRENQNITNDCGILMFDHVLDLDTWTMFQVAFNHYCYPENRTLIVIAPGYDQFLLDKIRKDAYADVKTYEGRSKVLFRTIFLKNTLYKPIMKDMFNDLSALLGATIYRPADTKEWAEWIREYNKECTKARSEGAMRAPEFPQDMIEDIGKHIGYCDQAIMGDRISSFKGFTNKNTALFNSFYQAAKFNLEAEEERALSSDSIDNKVFDARTRFNKITCKSATINVSGNNRLEMSINVDAVDDAVKACSSAIKYGYNQGCNLAIIEAIDKLKANKDIEEDSLDSHILEGLRDAFINVYKTVLRNGIEDVDMVEAIVNTSIETGYKCYDLATHKFDNEGHIINSCRTDIEILKGAIAMVAVVLSCNQYISERICH